MNIAMEYSFVSLNSLFVSRMMLFLTSISSNCPIISLMSFPIFIKDILTEDIVLEGEQGVRTPLAVVIVSILSCIYLNSWLYLFFFSFFSVLFLSLLLLVPKI